jgi:hypothetical protein
LQTAPPQELPAHPSLSLLLQRSGSLPTSAADLLPTPALLKAGAPGTASQAEPTVSGCSSVLQGAVDAALQAAAFSAELQAGQGTIGLLDAAPVLSGL